jgi:hypothetical protein
METRSFVLLVAVMSSAACSDVTPTATVPVFDVAPAMSVVANGASNAAVPLSGHEEVPARGTRARGNATFHLSEDGSTLSYKLVVANIENVVQSHIHIGPAGANGPIGVFLYGLVASGGGQVNGVIAEGAITAANFIGPLAGATMQDLIDHMQAGNAYVNVHTNDGVDPTNTGPGDFPGGEVRGQIR